VARRCQVVNQLIDRPWLHVGVDLCNGRRAWTSHTQALQTTPDGEWHQWRCTWLAAIDQADHDCRLGHAWLNMQDTWNMATANILARQEHKASFPGDIFHSGLVGQKTTWIFVLDDTRLKWSYSFSKQKRVHGRSIHTNLSDTQKNAAATWRRHKLLIEVLTQLTEVKVYITATTPDCFRSDQNR